MKTPYVGRVGPTYPREARPEGSLRRNPAYSAGAIAA